MSLEHSSGDAGLQLGIPTAVLLCDLSIIQTDHDVLPCPQDYSASVPLL
jgi:hypothetical protein